MKKIIARLTVMIIAGLMTVACSTPKDITYIADAQSEAFYTAKVQPIVVRSGDQLSIIINSRSPEVSSTVNLPYYSHRLGYQNQNAYSNGLISGYTVDSKGDIDFPELGKLHVAGLTREQIADTIKERFVSAGIINKPIVIVEFMNLVISVEGEVVHPGRFNINHDKVSILDALSMAGDLTILGRRDNIAVIRGEGDTKKIYRVNICSADSLFSSPAFYLQQNDVVYVSPNSMRMRQSTVNGNNVLSTSFWISLSSLLVSVAILLKK